MFCKYCGAQVPDGAKFCPKCGATLTSAPQTPQPEAPKPPQPQQQAYNPEPNYNNYDQGGQKKPYMSMKDLFAGTKITVGVSKTKIIIAVVLGLFLVIVGLCSR